MAGTVSNIRYNGSANAPVDAGTYAITADFVPDDAANYNTLSGANAGNFVIQKAGTPVLTVSNSPLDLHGCGAGGGRGGVGAGDGEQHPL